MFCKGLATEMLKRTMKDPRAGLTVVCKPDCWRSQRLQEVGDQRTSPPWCELKETTSKNTSGNAVEGGFMVQSK